MKIIFEAFASLLDERIAARTHTTEDSVRYTLFAALLENGSCAKDVVLEYPHPAIPRAQIDTWIPSYGGRSVAIEFKYDRDPPSGKNQPKTQRAGGVFRDLSRLVLTVQVTNTRAYFVYLTTAEMAVYFRNAENGHSEFFALSNGRDLTVSRSYFEDKPETFRKAAGEPFEATISGVLTRSLPDGFELRIYQVKAAA